MFFHNYAHFKSCLALNACTISNTTAEHRNRCLIALICGIFIKLSYKWQIKVLLPIAFCGRHTNMLDWTTFPLPGYIREGCGNEYLKTKLQHLNSFLKLQCLMLLSKREIFLYKWSSFELIQRAKCHILRFNVTGVVFFVTSKRRRVSYYSVCNMMFELKGFSL